MRRTGIYLDAIAEAKKLITDRPVFAGVIGPFSLAGRRVARDFAPCRRDIVGRNGGAAGKHKSALIGLRARNAPLQKLHLTLSAGAVSAAPHGDMDSVHGKEASQTLPPFRLEHNRPFTRQNCEFHLYASLLIIFS